MHHVIPAPDSLRDKRNKEIQELRKKYIVLDEPHSGLKFRFLNALSDYSRCIRPFLENVHDKYANQLFLIYEGHQPEIKLYCKSELDEARRLMFEL